MIGVTDLLLLTYGFIYLLITDFLFWSLICFAAFIAPQAAAYMRCLIMGDSLEGRNDYFRAWILRYVGIAIGFVVWDLLFSQNVFNQICDLRGDETEECRKKLALVCEVSYASFILVGFHLLTVIRQHAFNGKSRFYFAPRNMKLGFQ